MLQDVASVNIDSKLISASPSLDGKASGMVELQNGCACCSLSEELLSSVSELVMLSDMRGDNGGFHHIVVELSGVADPKSVRSKFQEAVFYDMPLMDRVQLDTMVTVIDCSVFLDHLVSTKAASPEETPELFYPDGKAPSSLSEDWMKDLPAPLLEALLAGDQSLRATSPTIDSGVSELMVEQTETADVILLNKIDLVESDDRLDQIRQVVAALNPRASIFETEYGQVALEHVLAVACGKGVVEAGVVDDHRDAVMVAEQVQEHYQEHIPWDQSHQHHTNHQHSHIHDASDHTHSHSHSHDDEKCTDLNCTDPTHVHDHKQHAGIGTFVYRARRPFHPQRLLSFLRHLPVVRGVPEGDHDAGGDFLSEDTCKALRRVLRSKGFMWSANSNVAALYWSHSGSSFDLQCLGRWWATLPREQWPPEALPTLLADFDDPNHMDDEDSRSTVGDRRQEIVFIGQGLGDPHRQRHIREGLNACLLDDAEWNAYLTKRLSEEKLAEAFDNPMNARMVTF
jgi:G3E family GTPase